MNSQISFSFMFNRERISGGGSTPRTRLSLLEPLRKAVFMSKLRIFHFWEAHICNSKDRDSFCKVGDSLGMSVMSGSSYPRITILAFAFLDFPSFAASRGSKSFHVKTHRHRKMLASGIRWRRVFLTGSVANHWSTSFPLAFSNSVLCSGVKSLTLTSTLCLFAAVATNADQLPGVWDICSMSSCIKKTSHSNICSVDVKRISSTSGISSPPSGMTWKTVTPVDQRALSAPHWSEKLEGTWPIAAPVEMRSSPIFKKSHGQSQVIVGSKAHVRGLQCTRMSWSPWCTQ